jgi:hypothetical protein
MSRSYRKPYYHVCGYSAHDDKRIANKAVRRKHKEVIRKTIDFEDLVIPNRYECTHNDIWSWTRDGKAHYVSRNDPREVEHLSEIIVEIDWLTQVERVLDGLPAINEPPAKPSYTREEWWIIVQRK